MTVGKVRKEIASAVQADNKVSVSEARKIIAAASDGKVTASEGKLIADLFEGAGAPKFTSAAKKLIGQFVADHGLGAQSDAAAQLARKVLAEFGLQHTKVRFPQDEVARQSKLGPVDFEQALRASIASFLEQGEEPGSPLYILQETAEPGTDPKQLLRDYLNSPAATLSLVPLEITDADRQLGLFPPENGETMAENWVISLRLPELSESLHWAITDRSGARPTYNYGFD